MGAAVNSFFRFLLGFSLFIAASLGIAFAVTTYAIERDKEEQTAAAFEAMFQQPEIKEWWQVWK